MRFQYVNQAQGENYHVARADIRQGDQAIRMVAYGSTRNDAEEALLPAIPADADILDMGSV